MRAALLHAYAAPPELGERPRPVPEAGESLVEVRAAPIAPLDLLCASGTSYFGQQPLPYVPGVQGVGVVAESDDHAPGTRVWFATHAGMKPVDGSLAEWAPCPPPTWCRSPRPSPTTRWRRSARRGSRPGWP